MNGNNVTFDTNALIHYFNGHPSLHKYANARVSVSIISVIEFLSYPKITTADETLLFHFLQKINVVDLEINNPALIHQIANLRKQYKIKLPDAVIAATAFINNSSLITSDNDFNKIQGLNVLTF